MFRIEKFDEILSTNILVKQAIEQCEPEGLVVCALSQSKGYGRRGNIWSSPEGGLYFSILLRPSVQADKLAALSLVAACSLRRAICEFLPEATRGAIALKWPNDLVLALPREGADPHESANFHEGANPHVFRKLSGISLEAYAKGVCLGVGVNVYKPSAKSQLGGFTEGLRSEAMQPSLQPSDESLGSQPGGSVEDLRSEASQGQPEGFAEDLRSEASQPSLQSSGEASEKSLHPLESSMKVSSKASQPSLRLLDSSGKFASSSLHCLKSLSEKAAGRGCKELKNIPVYLQDLGFCGSLDSLLSACLREFEIAYKRWLREGFAPFISEYNAHNALRERFVRIANENNDTLAIGKVEGIDVRARLVLRTNKGAIEHISSGIVHLVASK